MRTLRLSFALLLLILGGCVEADLGDAPLYCNQLEPRCPDGYSCVVRDSDDQEICVRQGQALSVAADGGPRADGL